VIVRRRFRRYLWDKDKGILDAFSSAPNFKPVDGDTISHTSASVCWNGPESAT